MSLYLSKELEGKVDLGDHNNCDNRIISSKNTSIDLNFLSLENKENKILILLETKREFLKLFFSNLESDMLLYGKEFKKLNQENVTYIKNSGDIFTVLLTIKK